MNVTAMNQSDGMLSATLGAATLQHADVLAAARGEVSAFERLVKAHQSLVCSLALAIVRDVEASEEVAQETFIAVWRNLKKLRTPQSFRPWLKQLTRARANDYLRNLIRQKKRHVGGDDAARHLELMASPLPDPLTQLLNREERDLLAATLEQLPVEAGEVLTLYYREGKSVQQVAALLEISEAAAKKRLSRARALLRSEVEATLSKAIRRTAPGAAFTAAVIASLSFAAPGTAAAAALSLTAKGAAGLSAGVWAGVLGGMAGGIASILFSLKRDLARNIDANEARGHKRVAVAMVVIVCLFSMSIALSSTVRGKPAAAFGVVIVYWVAMNICTLYGRRRVTRPRRHREYLVDPTARDRDKRELRKSIIISLLVLLFVTGMLATLYTVLDRWH